MARGQAPGDPSEIDALLLRAAQLAKDPLDGDSYRKVVARLHLNPSDVVFQRGLAWCAAADPDDRRLGADILAQLGTRDHAYPYRAATLPVLGRLLGDAHAGVVQAALVGLGHLGAEAHLAEIVGLAGHPDALVREGVAFALYGNGSEAAVRTLVTLTNDPQAEVRDWATFGLAEQVGLDTPEVRAALFARVNDDDPDTRADALGGLVRLRDPRVLAPLIHALGLPDVGSQEVRAARDLGTPELLESLLALRTWWRVDRSLLESAVEACSAGVGR